MSKPEEAIGIWERVWDIAQHSPCEKRKVGCLIIDEQGNFVSAGWNHNFGQPCEKDGETAGAVVHAEIMAVGEIPLTDEPVKLYAYISHQPCDACYNALNETCEEVFVKEMSPKLGAYGLADGSKKPAIPTKPKIPAGVAAKAAMNQFDELDFSALGFEEPCDSDTWEDTNGECENWTEEPFNAPEDPVNPSHYSDISFYKNCAVSNEAFQGFLHLNALKYLERLHKKDGALQDAKKAAWYLSVLIEELENATN